MIRSPAAASSYLFAASWTFIAVVAAIDEEWINAAMYLTVVAFGTLTGMIFSVKDDRIAILTGHITTLQTRADKKDQRQ